MVARRGGDPEKQLKLIAEWQKKADDAGVVFAWDRRKVGPAAKVVQPAADQRSE
jgi:hypothetical protein